MIRGVRMDLGSREFTIPALTLQQLEDFEQDIESVASGVVDQTDTFGKERLQTMTKIIHAALRRVEPALSIEDLRSHLDLGNIGAVFKAVMGASGLDQREPAEGEAEAEGAAGTTSAPASAAAQAGPGTLPAS